MQEQGKNQRIGVINALRGFAAVFVAWGHFVAGQGKYLGLSGKYGYLGVHIFFVISGFVIPWSLYRFSLCTARLSAFPAEAQRAFVSALSSLHCCHDTGD